MRAAPLLAIITLLGHSACPATPPVAAPDVQAPPVDAGAPIVDAAPAVSDRAPVVSETGPIVSDAGPDVVVCRDLCCAMCTRLVFLGCPEGSYMSPKGNSCADVCRTEVGYHGLVLRREAIVGCETVACVKKNGIACRR